MLSVMNSLSTEELIERYKKYFEKIIDESNVCDYLDGQCGLRHVLRDDMSLSFCIDNTDYTYHKKPVSLNYYKSGDYTIYQTLRIPSKDLIDNKILQNCIITDENPITDLITLESTVDDLEIKVFENILTYGTLLSSEFIKHISVLDYVLKMLLSKKIPEGSVLHLSIINNSEECIKNIHFQLIESILGE